MVFDEQFSFSTSRSSSLDSSSGSTVSTCRERSVSPCSAVTAYPTPLFTVTDLAATFGRSRLRQEAQICYDNCEAYANPDNDADWELDPVTSIETAPRPKPRAGVAPRRSYSPSQRQQRLAHCRSLCSSSHQQEIAALVARMVNHKDQCTVSPAQALDQLSAPLDEGYDSSDCSVRATSPCSSLANTKGCLEYRRSMEMKSSGARVRKTIRLRKDKMHTRKPKTS